MNNYVDQVTDHRNAYDSNDPNDTRNALPSVILFANLIPGGFSLVKINSIEESADVAYPLSF